MGNKSYKGSDYERQMARVFSEWWTEGRRTDAFWRAEGSGGRATILGKKGERSAAAVQGDLRATDEEGRDLLRLLTVEIKRGYQTDTIDQGLDMPHGRRPAAWQAFVAQAVREAAGAGTPFWAIVSKRNGREPLITVPTALDAALGRLGRPVPAPSARYLYPLPPAGGYVRLAVCQLWDFFDLTPPAYLRRVLRAVERNRENERAKSA